MSNWIKYKLSDVATIVDCEHKTAPQIENSEYLSVRTSNISRGKIDYKNCNRVSKEVFAEWTKRAIPSEGDIILAREAPVGEVGYVDGKTKVCLGQRTVLIKVNNELIDSKYLLYHLVSPAVKYEAISQSTGSVVEHLNVKDIKNFEVTVFRNLKLQKQISKTLSALDNKIDLLHRQNETLETLAETLFRQWFVLEADESWETEKIGDIISIKGGTTPSTKRLEYWNGDVYWTSPRDLSDNNFIFLFDTERKITEEGLSQIGSGLLPVGTVLLSSRAPIGYLAITEIPVAINQGYIAIICDKVVSNYFIFLWLKCNMETIINAGNGSTFMEISKSVFRELDFTKPPADKLKKFDELIAPMFEKVKSNSKQIQSLNKLRDTLLPKLMSGEVKIENLLVET